MAFPYDLVVVHDFYPYKRGDKIADEGECEAVMAGDNAHHVHRVQKPAAAPVAPTPVAAPAAAPATSQG